MAHVALHRISKTFDRTVNVVNDLTLDVADGEFVVLVGPSGCGKSTTLRMIAGLEEITSGDLFIGDRKVNDLPPKDRDIAMVFQNYALYGHMTVYDNIAFGLKLRRVAKKEIRRRVMAAAQSVGMQDYLERRPKALSGGQRQRVALARAIVRDPKVFLFDEPLSNLDAKLRVQMRLEIARLQRKLGTTTIYVTHDQTEAMTMADRIAVLHNGDLQQFDTPMQLYDIPANTFVAGFIGSPAMNFINGTIDQSGQFVDPAGAIRLAVSPDIRQSINGQVLILGIRPEDLHIAPTGDPSTYQALQAKTLNVEHMGNESLVYVEAGGLEMTARLQATTRVPEDEHVTLYIDMQKAHYFDPESGVRL